MKRSAEAAYLRYILAGVLTFLIFIVQYSGLATLSLGRMTAVLVVPSVLFCSMFMGEMGSAVLGLIMGVFLDCVAAGAVCFNALFLMAAGCVCSLLSHYLMNRNIWSAMVLSAVVNALYLFLDWLVFTAFFTPGAGLVLWRYVVPSYFYTLVLSVPLYFLFAAILKQRTGEVKRV